MAAQPPQHRPPKPAGTGRKARAKRRRAEAAAGGKLLSAPMLRGHTAPARLRLADAICARRSLPLFRPAVDGTSHTTEELPLFGLAVDVGVGDTPHTTLELAAALGGTARVVGTEADLQRLGRLAAAARPPRLQFRASGTTFALPLLPQDGRLLFLRAMNVLRDYHKRDAAAALKTLAAQLQPGGCLLEGSCDASGARLVALLATAGADGGVAIDGCFYASDLGAEFSEESKMPGVACFERYMVEALRRSPAERTPTTLQSGPLAEAEVLVQQLLGEWRQEYAEAAEEAANGQLLRSMVRLAHRAERVTLQRAGDFAWLYQSFDPELQLRLVDAGPSSSTAAPAAVARLPLKPSRATSSEGFDVESQPGPALAEVNEEHEEEMEVLASIYDADFLREPSPPGADAEVSIRLHAQLPESSEGIELQGVMGDAVVARLRLLHLPPLTLTAVLGPAYPEAEPPRFTLSAGWLGAGQLAELCAGLDEIWEQQQGMQVLFSWGEWLRSEAWERLGLEGTLVVTDARSGDCVDPRAVPLCHNIGQSLQQLAAYDQHARHREFLEAAHNCEICFDDKPGKDIARQFGCEHLYCKECMSEHATVHVTEGTIQFLRCPDPSCKIVWEPQLLRSLLSEELFARWDRLSLQRALDHMSDVVYCPRVMDAATQRRCETLCVEDEQLDSAQCTKCFYSFCTLCRDSLHPARECMDAETRIKVLKERQAGNKHAGEAERKAANAEMMEAMTLCEIQKTSKPCPCCKIAISKDGGCNKMTCANCGSYFCWQCGKDVTEEKYEHFQSSKCILFDEETLRLWNVEVRDYQNAWQALDADPQRRVVLKVCPGCKQRVAKGTNNNMLRCWNCERRFCFSCNKPIAERKGAVGQHYAPGAECKQHSSDK